MLGTINNPHSVGNLHTVSYARKSELPTLAINKTHAQNLADSLTDSSVNLSALVRENAAPVLAELTRMQSMRLDNPTLYARHCVLFAILSPQLAFNFNVELAANIAPIIDNLQTVGDVEDVMRVTLKSGESGRFMYWRNKAQAVFAALPLLQSITADDMTFDRLITLRGMGAKTSSMAVALWDCYAPVFTLDVWMMRLSLYAAGEDATVNPTFTSDAAYQILSEAWQVWASVELPELPVFAVQWTLWNLAGFGFHVSHLPIFGVVAQA
jgi:endonuclease III